MACATGQSSLAQLSKHFSPSLSHSSPASSLRPPAQPTLRTRSTQHGNTIEADWSDFQHGNAKRNRDEQRPTNQIEAMPPTTFSTTAPSPHSTSYRLDPTTGSTASLLDVSGSPQDSSPFWSPESESFQAFTKNLAAQSQIKQSPPSVEEATVISQSTPSDSTLSSFPSTIASTPYSSLPSSSGTPSIAAKSAPHPLTFESSLHSAWDFERLFHEKRMWFGGVRLAEDGFGDRSNNNFTANNQELAQSDRAFPLRRPTPSHHFSDPLVPTRRATGSHFQHRRDCADSGEEECEKKCGGEEVEDLQTRQRREHEQLRARMKERLQLVENHFESLDRRR